MSSLSSIPKDFLRWLREATTPSALVDGLKTAVWVVPLTVMIWVYAEQAQPQEEVSQPILLDITSKEPNRIVTVLTPGGNIPLADLSGSKSSLDDVVSKLSEAGEKGALHVVVPSDMQPIQYLNISDEVARADIFKDNGISVKNVRPQVIQIRIDKLIPVTDVKLTAASDPNLVDGASFVPPTVTVVAPQSAIEALPKGLPLAVVQIPTTGELASPGTHSNVALQVTSPISGEHVTITPWTASVTYTIKQNEEEYEMRSIPIRRSLAPSVPSDVVIDGVDKTLPNVKLIGPHDEIEKIKSNEVTPYATLLINSDDLTGTSITKTLLFDTGEPDVKVENPSQTVTFSVHRATSTP